MYRSRLGARVLRAVAAVSLGWAVAFALGGVGSAAAPRAISATSITTDGVDWDHIVALAGVDWDNSLTARGVDWD